MPPGLVIFDCDGVLVDSEMIASRVLAEVLSELGFPISAAQCREHFTGRSIRSVRTKVEKDFGRALNSKFENILRDRDKRAFENELKAVAGIELALRKLPVRLCVASSGSIEKINNSLSLTGLSDFFGKNLFSSTMVENGKPAPDLFHLALKEMDVSDHQSIVIEDSPAGIIAAGLANITVFGFSGASHAMDDPNYDQKLLDAGADLVFDDMGRLPELLGF